MRCLAFNAVYGRSSNSSFRMKSLLVEKTVIVEFGQSQPRFPQRKRKEVIKIKLCCSVCSVCSFSLLCKYNFIRTRGKCMMLLIFLSSCNLESVQACQALKNCKIVIATCQYFFTLSPGFNRTTKIMELHNCLKTSQQVKKSKFEVQ